MLFRRRIEEGRFQRLRVWLWPRSSWRRSFLYFMKRILRLSATPHAIAAGCAAGVFTSFTPFLGLHFVISFAIAWLIGGNLIAAALGTSIGNPLTFPFIWAATYKLGHLLWRGAHELPPPRLGHDLVEKSFEQLLPILKPMTVGAIPLGLVAGIITYTIVYRLVAAYQANRRERFVARRKPAANDAPQNGASFNGIQ
ncbi:DUF2062 domain-containing protein [Afifella marina]|uniref:DUF2062 domain-containing protein n=1 Tax=Afifella marina DSM 2698 TaxID=1120955 RepID=A0A1G5N191_AFIMA|nr:DUF2062 domain-containing protein [Afifella marina]MBK1622232.1 DUF2062 domain-containing protein [Afifella marina DSM 2698]MBK1628357.1 DUF2062 domain-containing protein [Afifella marina]MBK5919016.1 hypothetical protein [Afifella marina]RAI20316.1 hypothetical protein CH311_10490 [Afifella marina DSM 2698]SCZ30541.1 hypothetical protein SAMN03080610_01267 [Afifella marina DSM 2698]